MQRKKNLKNFSAKFLSRSCAFTFIVNAFLLFLVFFTVRGSNLFIFLHLTLYDLMYYFFLNKIILSVTHDSCYM